MKKEESLFKAHRHTIIIIFAILLFLALNISTLKHGHNWGGDFAHYIIHAQNLIRGNEYGHGIFLNNNLGNYFPHYSVLVCPPGYPVVLAPLLWGFGLNYSVLKLPNVICWSLWAFLMFLIIRDKLEKTTATLCFLLLLSLPWLFAFKQKILSDMTFLFFETFGLFAYLRATENGTSLKVGSFVVFLLAAVAALLVRLPGIALLAAAIVDLLIRRHWETACLTFGTLVAVLATGQHLGFFDTGSYSAAYTSYNSSLNQLETAYNLAELLIYNLEQVAVLFFPAFRDHPLFVLVPFAALSTVGIVHYGLSRTRWSDFFLFFTVFYLASLMMVGRQGPRYILPIAGIALIYLLKGIEVLFSRLRKGTWANSAVSLFLVLVIVHNVAITLLVRSYNDDEILQPSARELTTWVRNHLGHQDHYLFFKPRPLALLTGRTGFPTRIPSEQISTICEREGINWVILRLGEENEKIAFLNAHPRFSEVWKNREFAVFARRVYQDSPL